MKNLPWQITKKAFWQGDDSDEATSDGREAWLAHLSKSALRIGRVSSYQQLLSSCHKKLE